MGKLVSGETAPQIVAADEAELEGMLARIELAIRRRTNKIEQLRIDLSDETVRLRGRCKSFYTKQVAQHAAMTIDGVDRLINEIDVESSF